MLNPGHVVKRNQVEEHRETRPHLQASREGFTKQFVYPKARNPKDVYEASDAEANSGKNFSRSIVPPAHGAARNVPAEKRLQRKRFSGSLAFLY